MGDDRTAPLEGSTYPHYFLFILFSSPGDLCARSYFHLNLFFRLVREPLAGCAIRRCPSIVNQSNCREGRAVQRGWVPTHGILTRIVKLASTHFVPRESKPSQINLKGKKEHKQLLKSHHRKKKIGHSDHF